MAASEFRAALAINPEHALALNDLAWMLATDSDPANVTAARSCAVRLPIRASQRAVRLAAYTLAPSRYRSFH